VEEPRVEETLPATPTAGATFAKAVLLIVGGGLLGFFGCLGGLSIDSIGVALTLLGAGALVIGWGLVMVIVSIVRAFTKA
jgi:hypothetical protein